MSDTLGLSIGTANLAAARLRGQPVLRRSVLTLWEDRPADVGVPEASATGLVVRGFVERVGDPVPLVAADGSAHSGETLVTAALAAMARAAGDGEPPTAVVVAAPAHWGPATIGALRGALRNDPTLCPGGVAPMIVPDAAAALEALKVSPGLPGRGVVALCDFGAGGSSITLADAGAGMASVGETLRVTDFAGDRIDQDLFNRVLAAVQAADSGDTAGTAAVGSLTRLREQCRRAKERLSSETAAVVPVDMPGYRADVQITRAELEGILEQPFAGFLDALGDVLERNRIPAASLSAIATVGGGSAIPMIARALSQELRVPVVSAPSPEVAAAMGAAMMAGGITHDAPTGLAPAATEAATGLAPTAWAAGTAGQAATESASDGSPSATFRALAWSQDDDEGAEEPVPYTGEEPIYTDENYLPQTGPNPVAGYEPEGVTDLDTVLVDAPVPWYRRPSLLFGVAAALAAVAVGGLAITLTSSDSTPTTTTTRVTKPGDPPSPTDAPPQTVTVTGDNGQPTVSTVTPTTTVAPTTTTTTPTTATTTTTTTTTPTTTTTTTTTTTPTTTTTTTTTPTTTTTTRTTPPTTTTTTAPPPTTTTVPPPTTSVAPPTTTVAPPPTTTVAPPPTTPEPVITTQAVIPTTVPLPTLKPAPGE